MSIEPGHWQRFKKYFFMDRAAQFSLDISCMAFGDDYFERTADRMAAAFHAMERLEAGEIANPDENRMVGHYWLRNPELAPRPEIKAQIEAALRQIQAFGESFRGGIRFDNMVVIGIGGSALGPQFVTHALADRSINTVFFDNVDPDGMERALASIPCLKRTLTVVISKSGGTKETQNGYLVVAEAYQRQRLNFAQHAVAITGEGSRLDEVAKKEGWLARFPMWDWVGGRTSEMSAVGLLPAAIQGIDIVGLLAGAREMDRLTRNREIMRNPAAMLALMWLYAVEVAQKRVMVILPYKDRLELLSRYLQQLIMESIGKGKDLKGNFVEEGIVVFGNKGSTDQHAYLQQLREGSNNFFVVFIEVLQDRSEATRCDLIDAVHYEVEKGITCGDYLSGFLQGTRSALWEKGRESITVTVENVGPRSIGMLIALFERVVGYYASLVNVNAYHQPGVEAGKKAASQVLEVQKKIMEFLNKKDQGLTADEIARQVGVEDTETVFKILRRLAANSLLRIEEAGSVFEDRYYAR